MYRRQFVSLLTTGESETRMGKTGKYRIVVQHTDECMGDLLCCDIAPETFDMDDDDKVKVLDEGGNWDEYVLKAAMQCPNNCIVLYDRETGEKVWPKDSTTPTS
jgi:ferredoxin